jgi:hypothetical protein
MSIEFSRLDTSKTCDSQAIVMGKRKARGRAAGTNLACSGRKGTAWESCGVIAGPKSVSCQCDEVNAMSASGMIAHASLLCAAFTT